jgi:uncharacterized membrane protein
MWTKDYKIQYNKNMRAMRAWAHRHLKRQDPATVQLAVQALRNTIFVATFVGGFASTIAFAFLNTIDNSNFNDFSALIYLKDTRSLIVAVLLFCSFLNWAMVLRYASELAYLIDSSSEASRVALLAELEESEASTRNYKISHMAKRMVFHFSFGLRFMYISIPFAFLTVGPIALIIATVVILLFHIDNDFTTYKLHVNKVG